MATNRSIALNYLGRLRDKIEGCLYTIDRSEELEIYQDIVEEIGCIKTTMKIIEELEME